MTADCKLIPADIADQARRRDLGQDFHRALSLFSSSTFTSTETKLRESRDCFLCDVCYSKGVQYVTLPWTKGWGFSVPSLGHERKPVPNGLQYVHVYRLVFLIIYLALEFRPCGFLFFFFKKPFLVSSSVACSQLPIPTRWRGELLRSSRHLVPESCFANRGHAGSSDAESISTPGEATEDLKSVRKPTS